MKHIFFVFALTLSFCVGCSQDHLESDSTDTVFANSYAAAPMVVEIPIDALADNKTLAGVVWFLYESEVDPEGYNPVVIHCADDKFYQITFPEQMGPHRAEIFIDDFIVVKITDRWQHGRYAYEGNLWRNITQRVVYFENEDAIKF